MEEAFDKLLEHGVLGAVYVLTLIYFVRKERKAEADAAAKSKAWAALVEKKDAKIQELNDNSRDSALENMTLFNEVNQNIGNLVIELRVRNDGK